MGRLTTHVLDTARGRPGAGMTIELFVLGDVRRPLASVVTGDDGRCSGPLLEGDAFRAGEYELVFHVGSYFRAAGVSGDEPPFLGEVVVRFGIASSDEHYHVPLLVSPWSYTTYRGS